MSELGTRRPQASVTPAAAERDEPLKIPFGFADARAALLRVDPDSEPVEEGDRD